MEEFIIECDDVWTAVYTKMKRAEYYETKISFDQEVVPCRDCGDPVTIPVNKKGRPSHSFITCSNCGFYYSKKDIKELLNNKL